MTARAVNPLGSRCLTHTRTHAHVHTHILTQTLAFIKAKASDLHSSRGSHAIDAIEITAEFLSAILSPRYWHISFTSPGSAGIWREVSSLQSVMGAAICLTSPLFEVINIFNPHRETSALSGKQAWWQRRKERASKLKSSITSLPIVPRPLTGRGPAVSLIFLIFLMMAVYYAAWKIIFTGTFITFRLVQLF